MFASYAAAFRTFVTHLRLPWRKTQRENLIAFGAAVLTAKGLPVKRLARSMVSHPRLVKSQDKRLRRFLGNDRLHLDEGLRAYLRALLPRFGSVPFIPVMLDWTYVGERAILWLSIPYRGRSLPLFVTVHERCIAQRVYSQTQAEVALLRRVGCCWPDGAPPPLLLADRGFDKGRLLEWLLYGTCGKKPEERASAPGSHPWLFLIRSCMAAAITDGKGNRLHPPLTQPGQLCIHANVTYHLSGQFKLHLVVRSRVAEESGTASTWYLITNLPAAELRRAPRLYALRMQPEQTYRDAKRGYIVAGFGLHGLERLRRDRLERLLFLFGLVYGFLILIAESEKTLREELLSKHFRLALSTYALDILRQVPRLARRIARHACASTRFEALWLGSGDP